MENTSYLTELTQLVRISWIVLIPVGVLLAMVLYKLAMLLNAFLEFFTVARHELSPAIRDLRMTAEHVEFLSGKAVESVRTVEKSVEATRPVLAQGVSTLRNASLRVCDNLGALWAGIRHSFSGPKP